MFNNDQPAFDLVIIPMIFAHAAEYIIMPTHGFSAPPRMPVSLSDQRIPAPPRQRGFGGSVQVLGAAIS